MNKKEQRKFLKKIPTKIIKKYIIQFDDDGELGIHNPAYINIKEPEITRETNIVIEIGNNIVSVILWKDCDSMHVTVSPDSVILGRLKAKELPEELE